MSSIIKKTGILSFLIIPLIGGTAGKKSVEEIAREIIAGEGGWGNGAVRKSKLTAAGYDYDAVQNRINELLK